MRNANNASEMQPSERSFYSPALSFLSDIGFVGIQEIRRDSDYVDILLEKDANRFILEMKIDRKGNKDAMISGIVQAYRYSLTYNTKNIIVISYPSDVIEDISNIAEFKERALKRRVEAVILTEYWKSYEKKYNVEELFNELNSKIERKLTAIIKVETASAIIQKAVLTISKLLNKYYKDDLSIREIANHLTNDYGLFITLSSTKFNKSQMRNQTIDLLAYILVNQILFYFLYSKKSREMESSRRVDEIKKINYLFELDTYFDQIKKIDYRPIFDIDVVSRIPSNEEIVNEINELIECLTPLQVSEMRHDLYGRLIGNSLPHETRKILASYYTKTSSADLLASLTIDRYSDTVWDLACGSGTLLVSSYDRKMKLYRHEKGMLEQDDENKLHLKFIEKDITGTDIMPFACHLSGLNLFAKNLKSQAEFIRISNFNSLNIKSLEQPISVQEAYGNISTELSRLKLPQKTWDSYVPKRKLTDIKPRNFNLEKVDCVVINPPFTSINKLPNKYRQSFASSSLSKICGKKINLWGYFMSLADKVLVDGGKVGAIIPLNILRGGDTKNLRKYFLENYSIEYIIKPIFNTSFSEDTRFGDLIFIAKKNKPSPNHSVKIVCLKNDISSDSSIDIEHLASRIRIEFDALSDNKEFLLRKIKQAELFEHLQNLMPYCFTNNQNTIETFDAFINKLTTIAKEKLTSLGTFPIDEGFHASPEGLSELTFITRAYTEERTKRAFLILGDETDKNLIVNVKNTDIKFDINKSSILPALRTLTGIDTFFVENKDYFIKNKPQNFGKLLGLSKWKNKEEFNWTTVIDKLKGKETYLAIARRFRPDSQNTHFFAFYHDDLFVVPHTFKIIKLDKDSSRYQCLLLNSILGLLNILRLREQTTEGYTDLMESDLGLFYAFRIEKLTEEDKKLLDEIFDGLKNVKFPSILEQFEKRFRARVELDKTILKILGFSDKETNEWISKAYDALVNELKAMKRL